MSAVWTVVWSVVAVYVLRVGGQCVLVSKAFVTQGTCERFIVRVHSHVYAEMSGLAERFVTQETFVRLVSHMDSHMTLQTVGVTECFAAHVARIHFHSAVASHVVCKVTLSFESFAANRTLKRSLPGMAAIVYNQIVCGRHADSTFVALVFA